MTDVRFKYSAFGNHHAMAKVSKTQTPPRRRAIVLKSVRHAQNELLDKIVMKMIDEGKAQVRRVISEINSLYRDEVFRIVNEEDIAITFQFEANEINVTDKGILTANRILIENDEGKVYISVPRLIGDKSWSYNIWNGRADIKVKVMNGKGICEVRIWFPPLKLREIALKELEKKLSRSLQSL